MDTSVAATPLPTANAGVATPDLVLRNTLFLTFAQIVSIPASILTTALMARFLGPVALGYVYLGTTFGSFGYLLVDWGQSNALAALVATDRPSAGRLFGTSVLWRCALILPVYGALIGVCQLLGYERDVRLVVALAACAYAVSTITAACVAVMAGFERVDIAAYRQVIEQVATLAIVAPILAFGGRIESVLVGQAVVAVVVLLFAWRVLRPMPLGPIAVDRQTLARLLTNGTPILVLNAAVVLQPMIDATFLSKLAPAAVVGWYSAGQRLVGFMIFPAGAMVGALYPTLCRLHATDLRGFAETTARAVRGTALLAIPVALGCFFFPDIAVALYGRDSFLPAEDNLRVLSGYVFLLYFTMPFSISIMAAGRRRTWAAVQALCLVVNVVLDPILIPWFQRWSKNGGLGLCVAAVAGEVIVLVCAIRFMPPGVIDERFWRSLMPAVISGGAMLAAALVLRGTSSFVAAPLALGSYVVCLALTGGLDRDVLRAVVTSIAPRRTPDAGSRSGHAT